MRKLYCLLQTSGLCILIFQSCSKNSGANAPALPASNAINVVVSQNHGYELNMPGSGTVSIFKQASHYQTSGTFTSAENTSVVYKYVPAAGFTGKDQVILSNTSLTTTYNSGSHSCSNSNPDNNTSSTTTTYTSSYTTLNITVTN